MPNSKRLIQIKKTIWEVIKKIVRNFRKIIQQIFRKIVENECLEIFFISHQYAKPCRNFEKKYQET